MTLEEFTERFSHMVKSMARRMAGRYSGWFRDPDEERNDLYAVGMLELVTIFDKVDFDNKGYAGFVSQRVHGCMLNYIKKNVPGTSVDMTDHAGGTENKARGNPRLFLTSLPFDDIMETCEEPRHQPNLDALLFQHQLLGLISEFMSRLKPQEQFIFVARYHDRMTYQQIGAIVGRTRDTVSTRVGEIKESLDRFLERKCGWRLGPEDIED